MSLETNKLLNEIIEAYDKVVGEDPGETPRECVDYLGKVRTALDIVAQHRFVLDKAVAKAQLQKMSAQALRDEAWAAQVESASPRIKNMAPSERYSMYDLSCIQEIRALRKADKEHTGLREVQQLVQRLYYHLDGIRNDVHVRIKAAGFESSLER